MTVAMAVTMALLVAMAVATDSCSVIHHALMVITGANAIYIASDFRHDKSKPESTYTDVTLPSYDTANVSIFGPNHF